MNQYKSFFTTRPSLASFLMDHGCKGILCSNPYNSARPAWTFVGTKELYHYLREYERDQGVNNCGCNNPK